jgi:exodeoxyribonuclease VII small subunit
MSASDCWEKPSSNKNFAGRLGLDDRKIVIAIIHLRATTFLPVAETITFYFFHAAHKKLWTPLANRCITIETRSEIPLAKFEESLQRLEKIVQELEKGEVPLEKSLTLFEEGMQLSSSCRKELEQAEGKVEILLKRNGKLQAEPFEAATEKTHR